MKISQVTCIMCPRGCELTVSEEDDKISVNGNSCPRGIIYGQKEVTAPERMITTIKQFGNKTITLKSNSPVPKEKVFDCLKEIKNAQSPKTANIGDLFIKNVAGTTCNIVITGISK